VKLHRLYVHLCWLYTGVGSIASFTQLYAHLHSCMHCSGNVRCAGLCALDFCCVRLIESVACHNITKLRQKKVHGFEIVCLSSSDKFLMEKAEKERNGDTSLPEGVTCQSKLV
jgi:hypothetical protein